MILDETKSLLKYIHSLVREPKVVLEECIKYSLVKSEEIYNDALEQAKAYLESKNPVQVLKKIEHEQKKEDKGDKNGD